MTIKCLLMLTNCWANDETKKALIDRMFRPIGPTMRLQSIGAKKENI